MIETVIQFILSAMTIVVAGTFLARAADSIAELTKLGRLLVGSILLAGATSLPELLVDISAIRNGMPDLAVGNIFGSNSFNMIVLIPLDWFHSGNLFGSVSRSHVLTGLGVILATSVAVMGQLYHEEKRKKFLDPDALVIIAIVIGSLCVLYWVGAA